LVANPQDAHYWGNIGNSTWSYNGGALLTNAANAVSLGENRHTGFINCQFADGHVKAIRYEKLITDMCYWATDTTGAHPNCN
jgi:prepilin-type processing-associated H-X9-DG protein